MTRRSFAGLLLLASLGLVSPVASACGTGSCPATSTGSRAAETCPEHSVRNDGYAALRKDLSAMEKGIPQARMAEFLKVHRKHLEKVLEEHRASVKDCPVEQTAMERACPYARKVESAFKALEKDDAVLRRGLPESERAAFLKAHEANLKKLLQIRAELSMPCPVRSDVRMGEKV